MMDTQTSAQLPDRKAPKKPGKPAKPAWLKRREAEAEIEKLLIARTGAHPAAMTVADAHRLYMAAVHQGRASCARRPNKPRTILDKTEIYKRDIAPILGTKDIHEVTETDLVLLVHAKGRTARVRANRLAAELRVFFGWAASLRGLEVGLQTDPSARLGQIRFSERARSRTLTLCEIGWFLLGVAEEPEGFRRGWLLMLLTAVRRSELTQARSREVADDIWTIPATRSKNGLEHSVALGPWGRSLIVSDSDWILPADRVPGPRTYGWSKSRDRILARMSALAGHRIERFAPHDFRRTARSNTKRLRVDFETAEAMLNHAKRGLERTYDTYELEDEKKEWFLKWEAEIVGIALQARLGDVLGIPVAARLAALERAPG